MDSFIHGRKCFPEQGEYPGGNEKRKNACGYLARGYEEAAQVVRSMVDDMYQKTGAFNWKAYMESLPEKLGAEYGDWQEQ